MMYNHELKDILEKITYEEDYYEGGNVFYLDESGIKHIIDFIATDKNGDLILTKYENKDKIDGQ